MQCFDISVKARQQEVETVPLAKKDDSCSQEADEQSTETESLRRTLPPLACLGHWLVQV